VGRLAGLGGFVKVDPPYGLWQKSPSGRGPSLGDQGAAAFSRKSSPGLCLAHRTHRGISSVIAGLFGQGQLSILHVETAAVMVSCWC
jgi:hypothetical protein